MKEAKSTPPPDEFLDTFGYTMTFLGEGESCITITAPTWYDARAWAWRVLKTDSAPRQELPTKRKPTVRLRWIGVDLGAGRRRMQISQYIDGVWSDWADT